MSDGVFYASCCPETAVAEAAFYRLLFFAESPGLPYPKNPFEHTVYSAHISTPVVVDLTRPPYDSNSGTWMHPQDYEPCQEFERIARENKIEVICYSSVRDPDHRPCYAILKCCAFAALKPDKRQTWQLLVNDAGVYACCEFPKYGVTFTLDTFLGDSRLAPLQKQAA
jgi:hypothetical protein